MTLISQDPTNHHDTAPPRPRSPHQSPRHSDTHTMPSPPITTAQRHPDHTLPTNHPGTATPTPCPPHQSPRHNATQTTLSPPITMAQHSATQTTLSPPITTAQRHPDHALPTNHHGTATPTPSPPHQSPRHSATQTTLSRQITMAQRRHTPRRALIQANPKGTARRAHRGRARACANVGDPMRKIETNTVPPPENQDKSKNPALRIREKSRQTHEPECNRYERMSTTRVNDCGISSWQRL